MTGVSPQAPPTPQECRQQQTGLGARVKEAVRNAAAFIYETPLWIVAAAVVGVVLCVFFSPYSAPFFGIAGGAVAARLSLRVTEIFYPETIRKFRKKACRLEEKAPCISYIAFTGSVAATVLHPIGGAMLAAATGLYKGSVAEIDVFKYKQKIRRDQFKKPPGSMPTLFIC